MNKQQLKEAKAKRSVKLTLAVIAILFPIWIGGPVWWNLSQEPIFKKNVHGYMENAYDANTPELMIENLENAKQGMVNLGLKPEWYATNYPWDQTPNSQMKYQYAHIDSIINRAKDVIKWREEASHESGTQATDIYEQKMDNLRAFIVEGGWSDWIAHDAWSANEYPIYWWWTRGAVVSWFVFGVMARIGFTIFRLVIAYG